MVNKVNDIGKKRTTKNAQKFAEDAFKQIEGQVKYIAELEEKVVHLEELLKNSNNIPDLALEDQPLRKSHAEEIIDIELKKLHDKVMGKGPDPTDDTLGQQDLKKFDILVKDLVALKGKIPKKKKDEDLEDTPTAELILLATGDFEE